MNRSQARWLWVVIGVLLWTLVILAAYYVVHKPLSADQLYALTNVAADLLTWLAMLAVATALGSRLTRRLPYNSLLERLVFSAGLGLGAFSLLTLGLGLLGLLYRWLFWALLLGGALLLWREFRDLGRALRRATWPRPRGAWSVFLSLFIAATMLLALVAALLPPTAWDSLVYHLVGPDRYLQAHRLTFDFDNYYLFFPSFTEMLFAAGMALKGDVVPSLLHYSYLLLTIGALGAFARRYWTRHLGLMAAALFVSIPTAVQIATWSYVDLTLTFYNFAAIYALLNWLPPGSEQEQPTDQNQERAHPQSPGWLVLSGLFCGAAMSTKYTAVVSLLVLGAILLWGLIRRHLSVRRVIAGGLVVAGLALAVVAPWYVKNAVVAGNPLYPLVWGGRAWNEVDTRWLLALGQKMSLLDLLIIPWSMTVIGKQGTPAYDATISPLFLILLPLLLLVRRRGRFLGELLLATGVVYVFWIASAGAAYGTFVLQGRMVLPIFAPLSLLCAYSLEGMRIWDRKELSIQWVLKALVAIALTAGLVSQILLTVGLNPWPYLTGHQSRDDYQSIYIPQRLHQSISYLNENLTSEDKVFFIWEPRSYGLRIPHEADPPLNNFAQRLDHYGTPEAVLEGLRQEGFTHVLVNEFIYRWIPTEFPITPEEQAAWEMFQARYLTDETLVHAEEEYLQLYRLPTWTGP
jgi:hypothetical protein